MNNLCCRCSIICYRSVLLAVKKTTFAPFETPNTHIPNPRPQPPAWRIGRSGGLPWWLGAVRWQPGQLDPFGDGWIRRCAATAPQCRAAVITVRGRGEGLGLGVWPRLVRCPSNQGPGALALPACT